MSRYIRDDQTFREQVKKLADAGLVLGSFKKQDYPTNPNKLQADAYRTRGMSEATDYEIKPKGKFPEVVAGVVTGIVVLGIIALAILAGLGLVTLVGGAH